MEPIQVEEKDQIIFQNEQEIMKYVASFDMKLSLVLFKIQLNSLMNKQHYNTTNFFQELNERIKAKYQEVYSTRFNLELLEPLALEKINLHIFYQNALYREFLDETYFKNFEPRSLKTLILNLHSSEILMKIMEEFCRDELIEINSFKVSKHDLILLKEKTATFFIGNMLNLYKIKDLENDLVHSNYIMSYQKEKIKQLLAEKKSFELQLQKEREKNAKLMKILEKNNLNDVLNE